MPSVVSTGRRIIRSLLIFLAAYLRTPLAKFFMFHTSSSWGMYRPEGHVEEVLRLPLPLPEQLPNPQRACAIIDEVARVVLSHAERTEGNLMQRASAVEEASDKIIPLVNEYFGLHPLDQVLIDDTLNVVIPSIQPTQARMPVPTVKQSDGVQREAYQRRLCDTLNAWAKNQPCGVRGTTIASQKIGIGLAVLEKIERARLNAPMLDPDRNLLTELDHLRRIASSSDGALDPARGLMIFDKDRLFVVKPLSQRYWTQTAALNDADEVAGTILMGSTTRSV